MPGMIITGQGNLPGIVARRNSRPAAPGLPLGAAPSTSAATSVALADIVAHGLDRLALADDDFGFDPALVDDLADRRADDAFDAQPLLFLDRRLDAAPLDEILRLDDCRAPRSAPSVLAARRAAKRSATRASALSSITTR